MPARPLHAIQTDIGDWIAHSTQAFKQDYAETGKVWVLKFIDARFLGAFLRSGGRLVVSATPGFTWGDGVYVAPLRNEYSTMMYGRIGVLGWLDPSDIRNVYDASQSKGVELYQEWIQHSSFLYRQLTTTIHADLTNRVLRNAFRRTFDIDVVYFPPDQFNRAYVNSARDRWFLVSDWTSVGKFAPGQRPQFSNRVRECRWVAIVEEQFEPSASRTHYSDLIGPYAVRAGPSRPSLKPQFLKAHASNTGPQPALLVRVSI